MRWSSLCLLLLAAGCGSSGSATSAGASASVDATTPGATVAVGMEIVAATSKVAFRQGKILKIEGDKVTFEYGRPDAKTRAKPTTSVPVTAVWPIGKAASASAGDHVICKVDRRKSELEPLPTWYPCKVIEAAGGKLRVEDHYGTLYELDPEHVIVPDEATVAAIAEYVATEQRHRSFDQAFEAAGRPQVPASWKPKVGDAVVIHFVGTSWYGGAVVDLRDDKIKVDWAGDRWDDREVTLADVAPQPEAAAEVKVDQFALVRPKAVHERWEHVKVAAVAGDNAEIVDRNANKRMVPRKDLVPIVPAL